VPSPPRDRRPSEVRIKVEIELTAKAEVATVPGREAATDVLRELLIPGGAEFVTLQIEGANWSLTGVRALRNGEVV
jgi:hypothetical protein